MKRLQRIQQEFIGKKEQRKQKKQLDFNHFRSLSKIDRQEFKERVYGPNWNYRDMVLEIIRSNEELYPHYHLLEYSRQQMREKAAEMLFKTKKMVGISYERYLEDPNILSLVSHAMVAYDAGFSIKNGVHIFLYLKTIFNLGTEKHQKFIENAANYRDIGCFGLTQLLHGSNVKGLLTEAHYDHKNKQFIINSPSKQAMKFWIGAAAEVANISVIWAQLYIDGKCYGVHAYIVPIRDKKTHKLLPGVLIGDCGPKNGNNQIDNGFMLFDNVRIPFQNQLNRISGVDENGKFFSIVEGEEKRFGTQLGALSGGRFLIAANSSSMALSALTIAIRYSCVRRQFNDSPNDPQNLLIQYPLTRRRLMPLLAQAVVYSSGNMDITRVWDKNYLNILNPANKVIQELHGISSAIKPKSGWFGTETIKQCRQMLGGHGYSALSKLGTLYNDNDINNTWEGDNNVLYQQATKFVLDNAQKIMKGKTIQSQSLKFLADPPTQSDIQFQEKNYLDLNWAKKFLQYCLNSKIQDMGMKMLQLKQQKMANLDIWNNCQVFLGKPIAMILGDIFYLQSAVAKLQTFKNKENKQTFKSLIQLWFLKVLRQSEFVSASYHATIQKQIMKLCDIVTNESLGILDAISCCDKVIGSPFACPQGQGFEKYVKMVRNNGKENQRAEWWGVLKQRDL